MRTNLTINPNVVQPGETVLLNCSYELSDIAMVMFFTGNLSTMALFKQGKEPDIKPSFKKAVSIIDAILCYSRSQSIARTICH